MIDVRRGTLRSSPAAKLAAYGLVLIAALGGGAAVGAAFGPEPSAPAHVVDDPPVVEPATTDHGSHEG